MEEREKMITEELKEENRLLKLKVDAYKEELKNVSDKLDYSQKFVVLYESIIDASREEIKELSNTVKKLEKDLSSSKNKPIVKKKVIKEQTKKIVKKQIKKTATKK